MAKIIVTGHGHFATGLESTVELLAGPQKISALLISVLIWMKSSCIRLYKRL